MHHSHGTVLWNRHWRSCIRRVKPYGCSTRATRGIQNDLKRRSRCAFFGPFSTHLASRSRSFISCEAISQDPFRHLMIMLPTCRFSASRKRTSLQFYSTTLSSSSSCSCPAFQTSYIILPSAKSSSGIVSGRSQFLCGRSKRVLCATVLLLLSLDDPAKS